jgi:hypothetical protein
MPSRFPPGGTTSWNMNKKRCHWRETSYMVSVLRSVVNPGVGLLRTLHRWGEISKELQEKSRKRERQLCAL